MNLLLDPVKQIVLAAPEQPVPTKQTVLAACGDAALLLGPRTSEVWAEVLAAAVAASQLLVCMSSQPASQVLVVPPAPEQEVLQIYLPQNLLRDLQMLSLAPEPMDASLDQHKTLQIGQLVGGLLSESYTLATGSAQLLMQNSSI